MVRPACNLRMQSGTATADMSCASMEVVQAVFCRARNCPQTLSAYLKLYGAGAGWGKADAVCASSFPLQLAGYRGCIV
jgi:hypothetical protein